MNATLRLLQDGLRLSLLRRPRRLPPDAGFGSVLVLALVLVGIHAAFQWFRVEPPRTLNGYGVQTEATGLVLTLAASALLCAVAGRRALLWPVAGWFLAAMIGPNLVAELPHLLWADRPMMAWVLSWGAFAWSFAIVLRLAHHVCERSWLRAVPAALLSVGIVLAPWYWLEQQPLWTTDWSAEQTDWENWKEPGSLDEAEATIYAQPERLQAALDALQPQRAGHVDLYGVAFGGDASEDVFRNEVDYVQRLLEDRLDARGRVLALLNHPESTAQRPLATATNLERGLRGVAQRMDVEEDILFLYLTSHGSDDHWLYVNQPPLPLDQVSPERLRKALDAAGIRWRVLAISACYSGGWIDELRDPHTLVVTAARADRTSFGCGAESDITWFGDAFLANGLNETVDFTEAFARAKKLVADWERKDDYEPSEPQLDEGARIGAKLREWRAGFTPGPRVEFVPPED